MRVLLPDAAGGWPPNLQVYRLDSLRVSLKCEPELAEALRDAHAAVLPGYHLNKRHWNTVVIDGSIGRLLLPLVGPTRQVARRADVG